MAIDIGIEVEELFEDTGADPSRGGRKRRYGPFRFRCRALGLEHESAYLATGVDEMRQLRLKELERRLAERPDDRELKALVAEAREDYREDADEVVEMLGFQRWQYRDEIETPDLNAIARATASPLNTRSGLF
jgi:hypothetical protein